MRHSRVVLKLRPDCGTHGLTLCRLRRLEIPPSFGTRGGSISPCRDHADRRKWTSIQVKMRGEEHVYQRNLAHSTATNSWVGYEEYLM